MQERTTERPTCKKRTGIKVVGTGGYVPDDVVTNDHLFERFGCDSDWIVKRTGIFERRHAPAHIATSDMAVMAGQRCIEKAGVNPRDIDLCIVATFTPDYSFPTTACLVQDRLKLLTPAMDLQCACAGFMYAYVTGAAYVTSGMSQLALIIGADCNTRVVNPRDVKTYPLFGDGAGAILMTRGESDQGMLAYSLGSDGHGGPLLVREACGSKHPPTHELLDAGKHFMYMDGRAVFRWAVAILCDTIQDVCKASGFSHQDVDLFFPHQANVRIINSACDVLKIPRSRVITNLDKFGNTSAASIPLALDELSEDGRLTHGKLIVMSGFGAGLAWGTALVRW